MKIVKENLSGCINGSGAPDARYWVIKEPINETDICFEFKNEAGAQGFIERQRRQNQ